MSRTRRLLPVLAATATLLGSAPWMDRAAAQSAYSGDVVWPLPPETPRIRYVGFLYSERDLGKSSSIFGRLKTALVGGREQSVAVERPHDVYVDRDGRMFVTNGQEAGFWIFDPEQKSAQLVRPEGLAALGKPMGLTGDGDTTLFIADARHRRVVAVTIDGEFVAAYGGPDMLLNPVDVALSPAADRVYVADSYLHQLLIFERDGRLVRRVGRNTGDLIAKRSRQTNGASNGHHSVGDSIPGGHVRVRPESSDLVENRGMANGEFRYPAFVAVAPDGTVYVSDGLNFRVQAFDPDGEFLQEFGGLGSGAGSFARPKGVEVDSEGHVYVVDAAFNNIQVFDAQGRLLLAFGGFGNGAGQLWLPGGITIDAQDRIFVADRVNNRIQVYQYLTAPEGGDLDGSSQPEGSDRGD